MSTRIVVGLDGTAAGNRAVSYARNLASLIGDCELILVYVVEWSPYSFQTPEENAERHRRKDEEIAAALERIVTPAVNDLKDDGIAARGMVKHGHVAKLLDSVARDEGADQIVIARVSDDGIAEKIFGSSASSLVMHASVPVTVVA